MANGTNNIINQDALEASGVFAAMGLLMALGREAGGEGFGVIREVVEAQVAVAVGKQY